MGWGTGYYSHPNRGVTFHQPDAPRYRDFAHLAFTIGVTFQVSDTPLTTTAIRRTALLHALMSYTVGTMTLTATASLIAGLTTSPPVGRVE